MKKKDLDLDELQDAANWLTSRLGLQPVDVQAVASAQQSTRVHELEQCLQSFIDFVEKPTIAGNSFGEIMSYAHALRKKAEALLEYAQE